MTYGYKDGGWSYLSGIENDELEETIAGIIACELSSKIIDVLQGHMPDEDNPITGNPYEPWEVLPMHIAEEVSDNIGRW